MPAAPIGLLVMGGLIVAGVAVAMSSKASAAGGGSGSPQGLGGMVPGHQYKIVFNSDTVSRNAPSLAAQQALAQTVGQLGFTRVQLAPDPTDQNLFTWRATATWDGTKATLQDGKGVRFVSFIDLDAVAPTSSSKYDPGMTAAQTAMVDAMLASSTDIAQLHTTADGMRKLGFPNAANALDFKAAQLQALQQVVNPPANPPQNPPNVPQLPSFPIVVPPINPFTPPANPPAPPVFVPPFVPPVVQPTQPTAPRAYVPRSALPPLPPLPGGTYIVTPQHRTDQNQLLRWAQANSPPTFQSGDVDGIIGPQTQVATQLAQAWSNDTRGTKLTLDGLFGAATRSALASAGY